MSLNSLAFFLNTFYRKRFSNADIVTQCLSNLPYLQYRQTKDRGNFRYYKTFLFLFLPILRWKTYRHGLYVNNVVGGVLRCGIWSLGVHDNFV